MSVMIKTNSYDPYQLSMAKISTWSCYESVGIKPQEIGRWPLTKVDSAGQFQR